MYKHIRMHAHAHTHTYPHLESSLAALVVLGTILVIPIPYLRTSASSLYVSFLGTNPDSYIQGPEQ